MNDQKNTDTSIEGAVSAAADLGFTPEASKENNEPYRLYLREDQIPTQYYNVRADMPEKPEPMRLPNGKAAAFENIRPVFCDELVRQELDDDTRYIDIPEGVREMYKVYRPSPLCRAYNLERALGTPAKIFYKFEGNNTSGSHKLNSALAQAYYGTQQGLSTITTETGAGQWGTALSEAAAHYGLDCEVFMVKCSYEQKPFRRNIMQTFGANVTPSPSDTTEIGRKMLADDPTCTGSLGTAISEAVEKALHVPENRGRYAYDFADTGQTCPLCKMYTLGNGFIPSADHAGGLRYHGMSPIVSKLVHDGYARAVSVKQTEVFQAGVQFAKLETILPAPESSHAIKVAIDEALKCKETGEAKTILFGLTGTGYFDMMAYDAFINGKMEDHIPTDEELEAGFATIPAVPGIQAEGGLPLE